MPDWDGSIAYDRFPRDAHVTQLESFLIPQGVPKGRFGIRTAALATFRREHPNEGITIKVVRDTPQKNDGGLLHGFASRRHPTLPAPTLAVGQMVNQVQ
ncbi:hypothetical protein N9B17_04715 [Rhodopirellula sp.]|nr:hypothetical protein [Rhodopirellula sp.]